MIGYNMPQFTAAFVLPRNRFSFFNCFIKVGVYMIVGFWFAIGLLIMSNLFMNFAWFGHLKLNSDPGIVKTIFISWGIALFEYILMLPAVRIACNHVTVAQLKIIQEAISLSVFVPFSILFLKENFKWDYVWACCCILMALFFILRSKFTGA